MVRYRCFKILTPERYCVQSADFYRLPIRPEQVANLDKQFLELVVEQAPNVRTQTYPSLEQAIAAHDEEFEPHS